MTLLISFPLQVIISYFILHHFSSLPCCLMTYPLPSSHILSSRVHHTILKARIAVLRLSTELGAACKAMIHGTSKEIGMTLVVMGKRITQQQVPNPWRALKLAKRATPTTKSTTAPVRGHPSISLPPLSSTTLPLFICTSSPHLCTISRDYTYSRRLLYRQPDDFLDVDPPEVDNFCPPSLLRPEWHCTSHGCIGTGPCDTTAPSTITWTPIYGGLVIGSLVL
jgi:hypothetical protein